MGGGYSERLDTQKLFKISKRKFPTAAERVAARRRAWAHFLRTGESIDGVEIRIRWRNPDNKNPRHADWKYSDDPGQSLYDVWKTLGKGRGALQ